MTPRVALPFSQRVPLRHTKGRVCAPPPRTAGADRMPLGVTQVSDATVLSFVFFIILTKYLDVESKKLDAYEILEDGRPFGIQKS